MTKRCLVILPGYGMAGSSIYISQYINAFTKNKVEIHIIARRKDKMSDYFTSIGANLHYCDISLNLKLAAYDKKYNGAQYIVKDIFKFTVGLFISLFYILKIKPSIVIVGDIVIPQFILAAKIFDKHIITLVQCSPSQAKYKQILLRKMVGLSDIIIGITKHHINLFRSLDDVTKLVIPNTVTDCNSTDSANLSIPLNREYRKYVILCLSGIQEDKGTFEFVRAAHKVLENRDDIMFVLAGKFSKNYSKRHASGNAAHHTYNEKVFNYIHDHKLTDNITIIGEVNYALKLIRMSDIVVSLHIRPHFSRPIIEAFSERKAVIATDDYFNRDIIESGRNGYLIDPYNTKQFSETVDIILSNERYKEIGREAYNTYKQRFSPDIVYDSISQLIHYLNR